MHRVGLCIIKLAFVKIYHLPTIIKLFKRTKELLTLLYKNNIMWSGT